VNAQALVLRVVDFGESDRIVHLLTPERGRLAAIAKGAKRSVRRFPGSLDVFNLLRVEIAPVRRPGALARLEQARLVAWYPGLRVSSGRFALGCYLVELLDRGAPEGGPETAALFRFARDALALVEAASADRRLRVLLELRALDALGLRPELARCVRCGGDPLPSTEPARRARPGARSGGVPGGGVPGSTGVRGSAGAPGSGGASPAVAFHVPEGGPLCPPCALRAPAVLRVRPGTLRALEQALRLDVSRLGRLVLRGAALAEAGVLVERLVRFHVGLELRSAAFLDHALGGAGAGAPVPAPPSSV